MFASLTTHTVTVPGTTETVTVQKLNGQALEDAAKSHYDDFIAGRRPRGWPALFQKAMETGLTAAMAQQALRDPLAGYDRLAIVRSGVKGWSATIEKDGQRMPRPLSDVTDLDDEAMEFLAVEIMKLTKPTLFQTPEEQAAAQKND